MGPAGTGLTWGRTIICRRLELDPEFWAAAGDDQPAGGMSPAGHSLVDETVVKQRGDEFTLFAAVDPETRPLLQAAFASSRNYLTCRWFLEELREVYGRIPPIGVTGDAIYGPPSIDCISLASSTATASETVSDADIELKRCIDTLSVSFIVPTITTTYHWLRQFAWVWNKWVLLNGPNSAMEGSNTNINVHDDGARWPTTVSLTRLTHRSMKRVLKVPLLASPASSLLNSRQTVLAPRFNRTEIDDIQREMDHFLRVAITPTP